MGIRHRKGSNKKQDADVESNDTVVEQEKGPEYKGDEYEQLLQFVAYEAERSKRGGNEDEEEDSGDHEKRLWYAPWKKVRVQGTGDRKVPQDWLQTDHAQGLSDAEVEKRRSQFGYNELESPRENQILKFLSFFNGPILWAMEVAVILAAGLRDWIDFGVIIGILMLNAFVGWYQEKQAGDIVEKLKAGIALKATVIRNGKESEIEAREVVPGDIIVLDEAQTIPAEAKLISSYEDRDNKDVYDRLAQIDKLKKSKKKGSEDDDSDDEDDSSGGGKSKDLKGSSIGSVDQSAITGESLPVDKFLGDTLYYTCGVKRGKFLGIVTASARGSFVGKTASLVTGSNDEGHFKQVLNGIGNSLLVLVAVFILAMLIGGFFRSIGIASPRQNNLLVYALIFLIIGVPVGLPCVTTTTMAVGAAYLAKQKAIVQKLTAIESLAGVDILCSDKTGTLTANKLSLNDPYVAEGVDINWFMAVAVLSSSHNIKALDPIDKVTVTSLKDYPKAQEILKRGWKTHKFTPFDPVSKRITAEVEDGEGKKYTCAKGAPNAILRLRQFDKQVARDYRAKTHTFASRGFRSLGVAIKEEGKDWELLGLISMSDPPRHDTPATVREAQDLGISIKMLTGDAVAIAKETCRQLALGDKVYDSERLLGGGMTGSEVTDFLEAADGFAEVFPEHKYQVVEMLKMRGHLVAMTGDGVNDAPALKKADCGIAVEGASSAAQSAADIVFLDEGLSTIITAVKVSREIFHRMRAYIQYRIALCLHLEIYLLLSMLILNETIRVDLIVFLAIFADVATIAIAYDNSQSARRPTEWQLGKIWVISVILGGLLAAGTWIARGTLFLGGAEGTGGIIQNYGSIQEILFLEVALTESWLILVTRVDTSPDSGKISLPSWQLVGAVFGVDILATVFAALGWLSGPAPRKGGWVDIVTLIRVWAFSVGVTVVVAMVYFVLNRIPWLANLGRKRRSHKDSMLENFITELQRLSIVHERTDNDLGVYRFKSGAIDTEEEEGKGTDAKQASHKDAEKTKEEKERKSEKGQDEVRGSTHEKEEGDSKEQQEQQ
ncbi:plasma-membrane proton-efflux P-type ATPase [Sporobolomyces salmoneus]|uniref:plasma-membrane proton-efflux P-type ATPase n=1 Tax=Sporobolomyces salmoneus TaxID=183962 RepID=UPI0031749C00